MCRRSLGGAVAVFVASHQKYSSKLAGVILENTFTSIPSLAKVRFAELQVTCILDDPHY